MRWLVVGNLPLYQGTRRGVLESVDVQVEELCTTMIVRHQVANILVASRIIEGEDEAARNALASSIRSPSGEGFGDH